MLSFETLASLSRGSPLPKPPKHLSSSTVHPRQLDILPFNSLSKATSTPFSPSPAVPPSPSRVSWMLVKVTSLLTTATARTPSSQRSLRLWKTNYPSSTPWTPSPMTPAPALLVRSSRKLATARTPKLPSSCLLRTCLAYPAGLSEV